MQSEKEIYLAAKHSTGSPLEGKDINGVYNALKTLAEAWTDGTFTEILEDWKWIFSYSVQYKWVIAFYLVLGIIGTTMGLVSTVLSKYLIDIVTGYKTDKFPLLLGLMIGSTVFSLTVGNLLNRFTLKIGIDIGNAIQADIFDKIIDSDWLALDQYNNGDLLNRFNSDVSTISGNAISWLPSIVLAVYHFVATFGSSGIGVEA